MTELVEFFSKLFRLKLWIKTFEFLVFAPRPRGNYAKSIGAFGAQRFLVLSILVLACNIAYRGEAIIAATGGLIVIALSGVAVMLATVFCLYLLCRNTKSVAFYLNVLVSHFMLCVSLLLVLTLSGFANQFDQWSPGILWFAAGWDEYLYLSLMSGSFALFCSLIVTVGVTLNTAHFLRNRPAVSLWGLLARATFVTLFSTALLFAYTTQKLPADSLNDTVNSAAQAGG